LERGETAAGLVAPQQQPAFIGRFVAEIRNHALFWLFAITLVLASQWVKSYILPTTLTDSLAVVIGLIAFWPSLFPALLPLVLFRMAVIDRCTSPARDFFPSVKRFLTADGRFLRGFVMMLAIFAFINGFSSLKSLITYVQPFSWDATFDEWDRILHFGYRPWELLHPILAYPPVTMLINVNYNFWFVTLTMYWLHFAFAEQPGFRRSQAVTAYMLTWSVGGVILAMLFSSAGPCYYGNLGLGSNPDEGLMGYLQNTNASWPIWAVDLQNEMWLNHTLNRGLDVTKGISAMPSMHNAQCLLLVLVTWNRGKLFRNLAIAHGVLVFLGSIHLGWHYAVDAYLAYALVAITWPVATYIARAWENRRSAAVPAF
jgi:PAP2 superfamily